MTGSPQPCCDSRAVSELQGRGVHDKDRDLCMVQTSLGSASDEQPSRRKEVSSTDHNKIALLMGRVIPSIARTIFIAL